MAIKKSFNIDFIFENFRYNFWMIVIIALLINLIAGIVIKIFEALFQEALKNVYVLILSIIIILIFIIIIIPTFRT